MRLIIHEEVQGLLPAPACRHAVRLCKLFLFQERAARRRISGTPTTRLGWEAPTEISTDLSSGASSADKKASEDVKKPSLPAISAKPSYGLMTPPAAQKPEPDLLPGTDKQKVVLNFEKADVAEVTNQIFGDYLKLNYVLDPGLQGRLSFYLEGEFSREELYQMI